MPTSPDPRAELASTYMVADRSNEEELARLLVQERLLTSSMGGVLAEQPDPGHFQHILDVGCGPGGWLIETAQTYPEISSLVGIDISSRMLQVARERIKGLQMEKRVEFQVMDALQRLEFPNASFDLVNQRAGISWLRKWDWPRLLREYQRVLRTNGVLRITEVNGALESTSSALVSLWNLASEAFYQAGIAFSLGGDHLDEVLASLIEQQGLKQVQSQTSILEYHSGTPDGQLLVDDLRRLFRTIKPFLEKWLRLPANYDELHRKMLQESAQPDFVATAKMFTVWGTKLCSSGRSPRAGF